MKKLSRRSTPSKAFAAEINRQLQTHSQADISNQNNLLIVFGGNISRSKELASSGGWSRYSQSSLGNLIDFHKSILNEQDSTLISLCHYTDEIDNGAYFEVLRFANEDPTSVLFTSDEVINLSSAKKAKPSIAQFRSALTPFRLLVRAPISGLVTIRASALKRLYIRPSYLSMHSFTLDICLQIAGRGLHFGHISLPLLLRRLASNPGILDLADMKERQVFTDSQIKEINSVVNTTSSGLLRKGGRTIVHPRAHGCRLLKYTVPDDTLVSIVAVCNEGGDPNKDFISSVNKNSGSILFEIVKVDASPLLAHQEAKQVSRAHGQSRAHEHYGNLCNQARLHCKGNYILFVNDAIRFTSRDFLQNFLDPFACNDVAVVSPRILNPQNSIQHQGYIITQNQRGVYREPGKGFKESSVIDRYIQLIVQEQFSATSCDCFLIKSDWFDIVDGFDPRLNSTHAGIDIGLKVHSSGGSIIASPDIRVVNTNAHPNQKPLLGCHLAEHQKEQGFLRVTHASTFKHGDTLVSPYFKLNVDSYEYEIPITPKHPRVKAKILYSWEASLSRDSSEKPLMIFAQFSKNGLLRPDILYQLREYSRYVEIVFVGATPAIASDDKTLELLRRYCSKIIIRENEGYDFGSWKTGLDFLGQRLALCKEVILTNDSFFGPFHSFGSLFKSLEKSNADMVALTDNLLFKPHLQSAFISYRSAALHHDVFISFWENLVTWPTKREIVRNCEVELSWSLKNAGLSSQSLYSYNANGNILHFEWKSLVTKRLFPFVKVSLLRDNPTGQSIEDWDKVLLKYNPELVVLIRKYLSSMHHQDQIE
mgnify:CR=1 FL=1